MSFFLFRKGFLVGALGRKLNKDNAIKVRESIVNGKSDLLPSNLWCRVKAEKFMLEKKTTTVTQRQQEEKERNQTHGGLFYSTTQEKEISFSQPLNPTTQALVDKFRTNFKVQQVKKFPAYNPEALLTLSGRFATDEEKFEENDPRLCKFFAVLLHALASNEDVHWDSCGPPQMYRIIEIHPGSLRSTHEGRLEVFYHSSSEEEEEEEEIERKENDWLVRSEKEKDDIYAKLIEEEEQNFKELGGPVHSEEEEEEEDLFEELGPVVDNSKEEEDF